MVWVPQQSSTGRKNGKLERVFRMLSLTSSWKNSISCAICAIARKYDGSCANVGCIGLADANSISCMFVDVRCANQQRMNAIYRFRRARKSSDRWRAEGIEGFKCRVRATFAASTLVNAAKSLLIEEKVRGVVSWSMALQVPPLRVCQLPTRI